MKQLNCRSATELFRCQTNTHGSNQTKFTDPRSHPSNLYKLHAPYTDAIKGYSGFTQDQYKLRFTKTYLLRAGAYVGSGNTSSKTTDINLVPVRSNDASVTTDNVTIDYILDVSVRELGK